VSGEFRDHDPRAADFMDDLTQLASRLVGQVTPHVHQAAAPGPGPGRLKSSGPRAREQASEGAKGGCKPRRHIAPYRTLGRKHS
jgi:hypothetical protein